MPSTNTLRLRRLWFQIHKWIGLLLAILIIPISLSGSALVWHDWIDLQLNPERKTAALPSLAPSAYEASARSNAAPGERLASLGYPEAPGAVLATLSRGPRPGAGRPVRTLLYLDPASARVLDRGASDEGVMRVLHVLHGSLMVPGFGRQVVGWVGVAMLLSSLSGLWLWSPVKGSFTRGLRWRRQATTSGNLHHQAGFWILLPLAALSLTGAWISFPAFFGMLSGDGRAAAGGMDRMRAMTARPLAKANLRVDQALDASSQLASGRLVSISWPTDKEPSWKFAYQSESGRSDVQVSDRNGEATPPKAPQPESLARLMRRIHDGTGMGPVWQAIIFLGGIVPALLAVTGIMMWLNGRRRGRAMAIRRQVRPAL